jgi:hypothetical protein
MSNQPEWIVGHDGNWIMNEARIEPTGERYILNVQECWFRTLIRSRKPGSTTAKIS